VTVSFVDQVVAYLANSVNDVPFISTIGLAAFAGTSFTQRYGQGGFQVDSVTLGDLSPLKLQVPVMDDIRIIGTRDRRNERPERQWIDYRVHKQEQIGWVDVSFTTPAQFALHAVPGTLVLGPGADVEQNGTKYSVSPTCLSP
jgi:hypothetical protein